MNISLKKIKIFMRGKFTSKFTYDYNCDTNCQISIHSISLSNDLESMWVKEFVLKDAKFICKQW